MSLLCWKWPKNLPNGLNIWEMTHVFGKWLKYLRNGYNVWEMMQICMKWLKYVGYVFYKRLH